MKVAVYCTLYVVAAAAANLSSSHFGPEASVVNAFLFIGFTLTTRDALYDFFASHRVPKLAALIGAGSLASLLAGGDSRIAMASCLAFAAAETVDSVVYWLRRRSPWLERANTSNIAGAGVDSLVFPALAFPGPLLWAIVFGQFTAKIAGGFIWSLIIRGRRDRVAPVPA